MTTLAEWIADVRSEVDGNRGERFNRLAIDYIPGSGSLTLLRDLNGIGPNTLVTVGLNTLLVEATSATAKTLTVIGGFNGSPDSAASTGDLVRVGPRFTDHRILRALNNALASMSNPKAGLFAVGTSVLAYDGVREGYGLTAPNILKVLDVHRDTLGPEQDWPRVRGWDFTRSADTTDFPTGLSLRVRDTVDPGASVRVTYAAGFTALSALTDNVTVTGLHPEAWDIPPVGAAIRLMAGREIPRTSMAAQPDPRRAEEVPPGSTTSSVAALRALYVTRLGEESARLRSRYPI
jgi:hypothetical protein